MGLEEAEIRFFCGCVVMGDDGRLFIRWRYRMAMERLSSRTLPAISSILLLGGALIQRTSRAMTVKLDSERLLGT